MQEEHPWGAGSWGCSGSLGNLQLHTKATTTAPSEVSPSVSPHPSLSIKPQLGEVRLGEEVVGEEVI